MGEGQIPKYVKSFPKMTVNKIAELTGNQELAVSRSHFLHQKVWSLTKRERKILFFAY